MLFKSVFSSLSEVRDAVDSGHVESDNICINIGEVRSGSSPEASCFYDRTYKVKPHRGSSLHKR